MENGTYKQLISYLVVCFVIFSWFIGLNIKILTISAVDLGFQVLGDHRGVNFCVESIFEVQKRQIRHPEAKNKNNITVFHGQQIRPKQILPENNDPENPSNTVKPTYQQTSKTA